MRKRIVLRAISDCTDTRDQKAGIGDICRALGKETNQQEVERITKMLQKDYGVYVTVVSGGGCVIVKPLTHAVSARYERRHERLEQWLLASATTIVVGLLGFFLGKFFGK